MGLLNGVTVMVEERESEIQAKILTVLRLKKIWAMRVPVERLAHNRRNPARGIADILALLPGGRALFIEVKRPGGHQEESQVQFQAEKNGRDSARA